MSHLLTRRGLIVRLKVLAVLLVLFYAPPWVAFSVDQSAVPGGESNGTDQGERPQSHLSRLATTIMTSIDYHLSGLEHSHVPHAAYVRPAFARRIANLRPTIMEATQRHNRQELSGMSDAAFAEILTLLLYNEHNGWLEDKFEPLRPVTPLYQHAQVNINQRGIGSNFSVWPANLRPSVALEILQQQVPMPPPTGSITVPIEVAGSAIVPTAYASTDELFAAITAEICQDELAVEYLAANLERGLYRAQYEQVDVTWETLAAWHNQGIVHPDQIAENPYAQTYIRRARAYLPAARCLIYEQAGETGQEHHDHSEQRTRGEMEMTPR